jgi:hypothetical protein
MPNAAGWRLLAAGGKLAARSGKAGQGAGVGEAQGQLDAEWLPIACAAHPWFVGWEFGHGG